MLRIGCGVEGFGKQDAHHEFARIQRSCGQRFRDADAAAEIIAEIRQTAAVDLAILVEKFGKAVASVWECSRQASVAPGRVSPGRRRAWTIF
jgi:hypothetical protein